MDSYENKNLVLRNKTIVGWNIKLKQNDAVSTWFRQRKLNGARFNTKVLDKCTIEPLKCLLEDDLFGVESNSNLPDPNPEPPIYAMRFCPVSGYESMLAIANEDGLIGLQNIHSKEKVEGPLKGWDAHHNAIFDLAWCTVDAHKLVTVSGDQSARLFNISYDQGLKATLETTFTGYERSVKCCEWRPLSQHEFATGDRANTIHIWDARSAKSSTSNRPDNFIKNAHNEAGESQVSVTGLLWLDQNILASVSGNDGTVKMWDLRKNYSLYKKKPIPVEQIQYSGNSFTQGYTSIVRSPNSPYLFVSCQDNTIYQYNALAINNRPVNAYTGAKISSFFIKCSVSACGNYLASGSADNNLHIWNTVSGDPVATLGPQEETINCVTWHTKDNILASCTDDMRHRIWRPSFCDGVDRVKGRATMIKTPLKEILKETTRSYPPSTPTSSGIRRLPATPDQADSRRLFTPDSRGRRRPGAAGAGHTPSIKAFLTPKNSLLRTPTRSQTTPNQNCTAGLTTTPLSAKNSQKRKLDLEDSSASKIIKLDSEVKDSLTDLINTNTSNVRISPTTFMSPSKKASALTPRKYQSPLKNPSSSKISPTKSLFADRDSVRRPLTQIFSPTANLPNSVRDGTSPRHCCRRLHAAGVPHSSAAAALTPPQTQKSNWLRQLTEEKKKVESAKKKVDLEENVKGNTAKVKRRKSVRKLVLQKKP